MTTTEAPAPPGTKCPKCGSAVADDQAFCLECGRRLGLRYRRPPSFRLPLALLALVVIAGGVLAGYAVTQATNDDRGPDAITVNDAPDPGIAQRQKEQQDQALRQQQEQSQGKLPSQSTSAAPGWPKGRTAYTIVLLTTKDKATANATAQKAITDGVDAGVLKTDKFEGFGPGLYVVFSGQYDSSGTAKSKVGLVSGAHPGAYARQIKPKP